ncbi:MAG: toprim domain-containing protein [Rickettsiales bacterium]
MNDIERMIFIFSKLPGLGNKLAKRIVMHLLDKKEIRVKGLIEVCSSALQNVKKCMCGNLDVQVICKICSNKKRDHSILIIVENLLDLWSIEKSGVFEGLYYVLEKNNTNNIENYRSDSYFNNGNINSFNTSKAEIDNLNKHLYFDNAKEIDNCNLDITDVQRDNIDNSQINLHNNKVKKNSIFDAEKLINYIKTKEIKEVIIATANNLEGQTLAFLISENISSLGCKVTRIATGIPIGGSIDYADESTISAAITLRKPFE